MSLKTEIVARLKKLRPQWRVGLLAFTGGRGRAKH